MVVPHMSGKESFTQSASVLIISMNEKDFLSHKDREEHSLQRNSKYRCAKNILYL